MKMVVHFETILLQFFPKRMDEAVHTIKVALAETLPETQQVPSLPQQLINCDHQN